METMLYGNYQRVAVDEQSAYKFGEQVKHNKICREYNQTALSQLAYHMMRKVGVISKKYVHIGKNITCKAIKK